MFCLVDCWRIAAFVPLLAYALGWAIVMAPWLAKNVIDTGNPVYPLGYRVFHGRHWDEAREAKWQAVHGPRPHPDHRGRSWRNSTRRRGGPVRLAVAALRRAGPLALLRPGSRRLAWASGVTSAYLFFTWWLLTHRLDRFWLPLLPVAGGPGRLGPTGSGTAAGRSSWRASSTDRAPDEPDLRSRPPWRASTNGPATWRSCAATSPSG